MSEDSSKQVAELLAAVTRGDSSARSELWAMVYEELHRLAQSQLAGDASSRSRQPTSLIHEAYMRLTSAEGRSWENRRHFFAAAAQAMRCIRVDDVRKRNRTKRGGGKRPLPLDHEARGNNSDPVDLLAIDEALDALERVHPRQADVAKLRYFAGLTVDETADALGVSRRTVDKDWRFARAWLHRALRSGEDEGHQ